jgi:hypothetical protein
MPPLDTPTAIPITVAEAFFFFRVTLFGGLTLGGGVEGVMVGVFGVTGGLG